MQGSTAMKLKYLAIAALIWLGIAVVTLASFPPPAARVLIIEDGTMWQLIRPIEMDRMHRGWKGWI